MHAAVFNGQQGYRRDTTSGIAVGDEPETIYMVTAGKHFNSGCCFDYGNAEINDKDTGAGSMEAVYWGNHSRHPGAGNGPWVMVDLENGVWAGNNPKRESTRRTFRSLRRSSRRWLRAGQGASP